MHELPHNHSKNPKHAHPLPYVGPYKNTCNNSGPFPDILSTSKVFLSGFFSFSFLNQDLLLLIYNTQNQNQNQTTLFNHRSKFNHLASFLSHHNPLPSFP
jgi:hypothetical protein